MNVAIYCRLSEEDRDKLSEHDDSASIQNQKAMHTTMPSIVNPLPMNCSSQRFVL